MLFSGKQFRWQCVRFTQDMFVKEAKTLCSDPALGPSQVQPRPEIVDVEDNFILTNGKRVKIIEVRKQKPNLRGVVSYRSFGVPTSA